MEVKDREIERASKYISGKNLLYWQTQTQVSSVFECLYIFMVLCTLHCRLASA